MTSEPLIAGRFAIRRLLGSGGTAAVFAADDTLTGRRIALKLLHPHLSADPATAEAFFEEVRAARSIAHPGLAEILDAGVDDRIDPPVVWIAMELVTGVTLADHVRGHGAMAPADVATLAVALLDALAAAHEGGIVHRDVTPANVMFDPGALALAPTLVLYAKSFFGSDLTERRLENLDELLPGASRTVTYELGPVGQYVYVTVSASLYSRGDQTGAVSEAPVAPQVDREAGVWAVPWVLVGVLLLAGLGALFLRWRRRRDDRRTAEWVAFTRAEAERTAAQRESIGSGGR